MRRCLTPVVVAAAMSFSLPALADCPPGAWFCAEAEVAPPAARPAPQVPQVAPPPAAPQRVAPPPPADEEPGPPPVVRRRPPPPPAGAYGPPPVVIYQPVPVGPPTQIIVVTPGYGYGYGYPYGRPRPPVAAPAPPPPPKPRWQSEFGLNLRVEGVALGKPAGSTVNAGLGGVGMSLRYRPVPHFAFDLGVDMLAGTDYNGFQRTEVPVSLSGILFVNPRSRVQLYLLGGGTISRAQVRSGVPAPQLGPVDGGSEYGATYTYAGGQGGGGFEFRLSRRVALDLDAVGFVRKRIDDGQAPEFIDPKTGQTTNVSGGALIRGGINFWW
jgi:hypothetical protein